MRTISDIFEQAIEHWRTNKGIGTAIVPKGINDMVLVLSVLQRIYARSPNSTVVIIVNDFNERQRIRDFITNQDEEENNEEFKKLLNNSCLKILTASFIEIKYCNHGYPTLCIGYHIESLSNRLSHYIRMSRFRLVVLDKLMQSNTDMSMLYSICPLLDDFKQAEIEQIKANSPVEEERIGVELPEDSEVYKLYQYYNEYISTSMSIFGNFDIIQQARTGNSTVGLSVTQVCAQIAEENGWNPNLDMSIEFNIEVDKLYNPIALRDRANLTYEIVRKRAQLLSDFESKLDKIIDIVRANENKKILIINKRGEFASKVTEFINTFSETNICGDYHDKVDNVPMLDNRGLPVLYKTGEKKGQPRMMAAQAQKTYNMNRFNDGDLRILSTSNAPDKDLCIDVDIIIITSPQCKSIQSYMYRLSDVCIPSGNIKLYSIYCINTMEEKLLENKEIGKNHKIVSKSENYNFDEKNPDFIVVD